MPGVIGTISPLALLIIWLNDKAYEDRRLKVTTRESELLLEGCLGRTVVGEEDNEYWLAGYELFLGLPKSVIARRVQRKALASFRRLDVLLNFVEEFGYTSTSVRGLLNYYDTMEKSEIGSDLFCVYLDLKQAIEHASEKTQLICKLIIKGVGPRDISQALRANSSRVINKATKEIADYLENNDASDKI